MILVLLFGFGLCFGSFINALVWRIHKQSEAKTTKAKSKYAISTGRSMCVHCGHMLSYKDLIPLLSWISLKGKCRYCHKHISWQYPLVELVTAVLFVASYQFWPYALDFWGYAGFYSWLVILVGLIALAVYDIRWMLLPNKIIFPLYGVVSIFVVSRALAEQSLQPILTAFLGVLVGGGFFYLVFLVSNGKWIGGGDVKLGFLLGALVGGPANAGLVLFIGSLLGSIIALPLLVGKKATRGSKIPFGPFLIIAAIIVLLFGQKMIDWYLGIIGLN